MSEMPNIVDEVHEYTVPIPETTPNGQVVMIQNGKRDGVHMMHAESPDQSELYFEVATYPSVKEHNRLAEEQQSFLNQDGCICTIRDDRNQHEVACGNGRWRKGVTTVNSTDGHTAQPVAASGAWTADDIYEMQWCFIETAFRSTLLCHFAEETIAIDWHENARFGDWKHAQLPGQAVMAS